MRKKLSLLLVALMAVTSYAVAGSWKVTADTPKEAESTYVDDALLTVKTVYPTTGNTTAKTQAFGDQSFDWYINVRNGAYPSADKPEGTKQSSSTSLAITPKKDVYVTFYYRHQYKDGDCYLNDKGDMKIFLEGVMEAKGNHTILTSDGSYGFVSKKVFLAKGKTYYASSTGTTTRLYAFDYEEPAAQNFSVKSFDFNNAWSELNEHISDNTSIAGDLRAGATITDPLTLMKITVDASGAETPNRFIGGPSLDLYGGKLTIQAPTDLNIKKIVINGDWSADNTVDVGEMDGTTWTGESNKVVFTIKANTRIDKITVRTDEKIAYAVLKDNILTFKFDKNMPTENAWDIEGIEPNTNPAWNSYYYTTVAFDDSFADARPDSCYRWFAKYSLNNIIGWASFNTSEVKTMEGMFLNASSLESIDLSKFDTKNVENMNQMFYGCSALKSLDLSKFNTEKVTNMNQMFSYMSAITSLDLSSFNTANIVSMRRLFYGCEKLESIKLGEKFTTAIVSDMQQMFANCKSLKALDLSGFDTRNVTTMNQMFSGCESLETLDVSSFKSVSMTNNWNAVSSMFRNCAKLKKLDLSGFTKVRGDVSHMFDGCASLAEIDLSNLNTEEAYYMNSMFKGCSSLTKLDLSNFNTSSAWTMGHMFADCSKLAELNIDNFKVNNLDGSSEWIEVVDETDDDGNPTKTHSEQSMGLNYMFKNCAALTALNLMNMNTSNSSVLYNNMISMFEGCAKLATIDVTNQFVCYNNDNNMFKGCVALPDFNKGDNEGVIGGNGIEPYCNVYGVVANLWINAGKFITFYTDQAVKVKGETGKIYTITGITDTEVVVKELAVAAAKTPLLIENNSENDAEIILLKALKSEKATEVTKYPGFEGTLNGKDMPGSSDDLDYYILGNNNYFVRVAEGANGRINPNRCWLEIEKANVAAAPQLEIVEATAGFTGITTMKANGQKAEIYDLQGRKVGNAQKGMYIMNGKKVVIK